MASPPQSAAKAQGLDLAAMLDLSSKYLGMDLNGFLHDPDAEAIRATSLPKRRFWTGRHQPPCMTPTPDFLSFAMSSAERYGRALWWKPEWAAA